MFCKWCGKKIANVGLPCPSCGKNQDPLENGNGFWDLCGKEAPVQPVSAPAPDPVSEKKPIAGKPVPEKEPIAGKPVRQDRTPASVPKRRAVRRLRAFAWASTTVLLLILIAVMCIAVGKIELCLDEISDLRAALYSMNTQVSDCFAQPEGSGQSQQDAPGIQVPEGTEPTTEEIAKIDEDPVPEETEPVTGEEETIDLDTLLRENVPMIDDSILWIETREVGTWNVHYHVYMADGSLLYNENVKVFWQKSADEGETWETVAEDTVCILEEIDEGVVYRLICLLIRDHEEYSLYCAVTE